MARVTVEDCILKIPNRFQLVMVAAQRSRGAVDRRRTDGRPGQRQEPRVALREIADETVDTEEIEGSLVRGLQKYVDIDEAAERATASSWKTMRSATSRRWASGGPMRCPRGLGAGGRRGRPRHGGLPGHLRGRGQERVRRHAVGGNLTGGRRASRRRSSAARMTAPARRRAAMDRHDDPAIRTR